MHLVKCGLTPSTSHLAKKSSGVMKNMYTSNAPTTYIIDNTPMATKNWAEVERGLVRNIMALTQSVELSVARPDSTVRL